MPGVPRVAGALLLASVLVAVVFSPAIATNDPARQFSDFVFAPPMRAHIIDSSGRWHAPFVYPLRLENRLERQYSEDRSQPRRLRWFSRGVLLSTDREPWFPLGTDALGRDVFARLVRGGRLSLGVAMLAAAFALLIGAAVGAAAGFTGGALDETLMRISDFILVLPVIYVVLTLRAALPLVLTTTQVFIIMSVVLAGVGWPVAARGVRAIIAVEKHREYAEAARALGSGRTRLLLRHLLPATWGFLTVQAALLVPAFIVAEATLSYVGLGFSDPSPSWGVMLQEAGAGRTLADAPWLAAPAIAIALTVLGINLILGSRRETGPLAAKAS
jgi:peptide/nickel transport system permease protein